MSSRLAGRPGGDWASAGVRPDHWPNWKTPAVTARAPCYLTNSPNSSSARLRGPFSSVRAVGPELFGVYLLASEDELGMKADANERPRNEASAVLAVGS